MANPAPRTTTKVDHASLLWPIQRIQQDECMQVETPVVLEEPLQVVVNGQSIAVLMRLPGEEKELAAGFCVSEGYVRQAEGILLIHHCGLGHPAPGEVEALDGSGSRNRIEVRVAEGSFRPPERPDVIRLIRSGCGGADVSGLSETLPYLSQDSSVQVSMLLELSRVMRDRQDVHRHVGGTHSAAMFKTNGQMVVLSEDVGRHNAVDKVVGHCLLRGIPLHDKLLVTSGRASYEMVAKAIRVSIPIVASMSAPTSLAVQLAHDRGLTLVGYLRGGRMNVYTHPQRISQDQRPLS